MARGSDGARESRLREWEGTPREEAGRTVRGKEGGSSAIPGGETTPEGKREGEAVAQKD